MSATFEQIISGTEAMMEQLLMLFSDEFRPAWGSTRIVKLNNDAGEIYDLKLSPTNNSIGRFKIIGFPGNRVLLKSLTLGLSEQDPDGQHFAEFCREVIRRCEDYRLLSRRTRLDSASILETASRQLNAADTPEAFAAVGNICRAALVSLGRELFDAVLLLPGEVEPPLDAASQRLKFAARYHWAGRSDNQLAAIKKLTDAGWDMAAAFLHRKNATREEAEIVLTATTAVFDSFSLLLPL